MFTADEIALLNNYFSKQGTDNAGIGGTNQIDPAIRNSKIKIHMPLPDNQWIFDRFNLAMQQINNNFYGFDLTGYPFIQYGEYHSTDSGHYDWHIDMSLGERPIDTILQTRKLSFTFLLNEPNVDFVGGELQIATHLKEVITTESLKGRIIAFPSWINHRVAPVTKGIRKSLVIWGLGPKFK
jgi:PKHD-type hydroxylase